MLNNGLINKTLPWQEKGRWYHALVESDGTALQLTLCDLDDCVVSGTTFTTPSYFQLVDVKCIDLDLKSGKTHTMYTRGAQSGGIKQTITLPAAANFTYYEFYFFGYPKES